jgi:hypothetical protein
MWAFSNSLATHFGNPSRLVLGRRPQDVGSGLCEPGFRSGVLLSAVVLIYILSLLIPFCPLVWGFMIKDSRPLYFVKDGITCCYKKGFIYMD